MTTDEERLPDAAQQNGKPLETVNQGEWRLSTFAGEISVSFGNGDSIDVPLFNQKSPMIFKLSDDWTGDGHRVRAMTKGHFILIAPEGWAREGHVPVAPEACSDTGFKAHFFFRDGSESEAETGGFPEHEIALTASGFELHGQSIFDDSEDGDLFVGDPPKLRASPGVVWARVGEERKDGWRGENFKPAGKELGDVLGQRQGRFFIRVYDADGLLDSGQFRYLRDLRQILVNEAPYTPQTLLVPPPTGHPPTEVWFVGADGAAIAPNLPSDAPRAAEVEGNVELKPDPDADDFTCALETGGGRADIVLKLPRVWWRLGQDGDEAEGPWRDSEITMTRREFREAAERNAVVRLRVPKRVKSVRVGFGDEVDRAYPSKRSQERERNDTDRRAYVQLPLSDFGDYTQIDQWLAGDVFFNVGFSLAGTRPQPETLSLIRVQADPKPEIVQFSSGEQTVVVGNPVTLYWLTRNAEHLRVALEPGIGRVAPNGELEVTPAGTTIFVLRLTAPGTADVTRRVTVKVHPPHLELPKLTARVQRAVGGWRSGRGFSHAELGAVGLTASEARRRSIPVDKRRRSSHPINVEALRRLTDA